MKLTTKQLMHILPMDERFRLELRATYEIASREKQFKLSVLLWDQYYKLVDLRTRANVELEMGRKGFRADGGNFYQRMRDRAEREIVRDAEKRVSGQRLIEARKSMTELIEEMDKMSGSS